MTREGFEPIENFSVADLGPAVREEVGMLLFEISGIFGFGVFPG